MFSLGQVTVGRLNVVSASIRKKYIGTIAIEINPQGGSNEERIKKRKQSKHRKQRGGSSYKFVDNVKIRVTAGRGGKGCMSYESKLGSSFKKRPDGGHGGHGGNVIIVADANEQSLNMQSHHYNGENGVNGGSKQMHGRNGKDKIIRVPCGVVVKRVIEYDEVWDPDQKAVRKLSVDDNRNYDHNHDDKPEDFNDIVNTGSKSEVDGMYHWESKITVGDEELVSSSEMIHQGEREKVVLGDLDEPGSFVIAGIGGKGGVGNTAYAKRQHVPELISKAADKSQGEPGEVTFLELDLKLIADIGLVGFPNAGKSSLLAAMSKAQPEIAPYPFTTLHPLVGTIEYRDGFRALLADVPGLISGAADGRGRGHDFLRHLERTKGLIYIVDIGGVDGRNPLNDLDILVDEIKSYGDSDMMTRPALVIANKLDLIKDIDIQDEALYSISKKAVECGINFDGEVHGISAGVTGEGLDRLSSTIRSLVETENERRTQIQESYDYYL